MVWKREEKNTNLMMTIIYHPLCSLFYGWKQRERMFASSGENGVVDVQLRIYYLYFRSDIFSILTPVIDRGNHAPNN
jgi:hypothetical protein